MALALCRAAVSALQAGRAEAALSLLLRAAWGNYRVRALSARLIMGALCCCPRPEDFEEIGGYPNGSLFHSCFCLQYCMRWCMRAYTSLFDGPEGGGEVSASPLQGVSAAASPPGSSSLLLPPGPHEAPIPDTYRAPPRPLPYDMDPRFPRSRDGLSRRDKAAERHLAASEADRRAGEAGEPMASLQQQQQQDGADEGAGPGYRPDSRPESPRNGGGGGGGGKKGAANKSGMLRVASLQSMGEEDSCPTCLDGYTEENPKILTKCGHHFHLGCIFEWMERSKTCPVCDKEMIFSESI